MRSKLITASAATLLLGLSTPAFAQTFTINGSEVPADHVERIQAHCDALLAAESGSAADSSSEASGGASTDAAAGAATAGTDASAATTGTDAGAAAGASTDASAGTSDAAGSSAMSGTATAGAAVDFATLDLQTIDIEACRQGGFVAAEGGPMGGAATGTDAGATTTTN